jgi:hypothetical protein
MMTKRLSKVITGAMVATLLWTGTTWTTATISAAPVSFSDVKEGHWAEKHVAKLAMQKILSGYLGKFNPNDPVSHQDAVIMAIRFMEITDELDSSVVIITPEVLKIKEDYKKYINLAFKKKLLNASEEEALALKDTSKEWGKSPASREWLTRLLVRAIGKESKAKEAATVPTTFPDDANIDSYYRGYVNVAVSTGLVKGVTKLVKGVTITEFAPNENVTRASAATLFSLAQSEVAFSGQVSGALLAISPTQLTLLHEGGVVKSYAITPDSLIYRYDSNLRATLNQLKLYGEVSLISNSDKTIGYVEQTSDTAQVKTYEGTLKLHAASLNRLTLFIDGNHQDFTYDPQHLPSVTDINGKTIDIKNLPIDVDVKLTVDTIRSDPKIIAISVKQSVVNKNGSGVVAAWNPVELSLQVDDTTSGATDKFKVAANVVIKDNKGANLTLDQLKVGDSITYEVKTGAVANIVVARTEQTSVNGVWEDVIKSSRILYSVNNKMETDSLADNVKVKIDGIPDATIDDIYKGDAVTLTFNAVGNVTQISVTSRTVKTMVGATVSSYDADAKTLIVFDSTGGKHSLDIGLTTRFDLNGTIMSLDSAKSFLVKSKKINVGYSGDKAVYVSLIAKFSGTVTENNQTSKTISLNVDSLGNTKVNYSYPNVEIYGQTSKSYADIVIGDRVTIVLSSNQDQVASILVHKNAQFEVVSVTSATSNLKVKRSDGVIVEWTLASNVALQNEVGTVINLSAFTPGGLVNVSFQGNTPVKVKAVAAGTFGKVTKVNTGASTIDLVNTVGVTVTKAIGTSPIVMRDSVVVSSLASIMPEDRVEIRMDENDRTVVQIITPVKKTIWKIENDTQTLFVTHSFNETDYTYKLDSGVYIHQGTTKLSLSDLKNDDNLSLYFLRGKLVEVVKL